MPAIPLSPPKHENQRWDEGDLSEAPPFGTTPMSPTPSVTHSIPHHAGAPVPAARPELAAQEPRQLFEVMIFAFHTHLRAPLSAFPWKTHGKFTLTHNELPTEWAGQMSHRQQRGSGCQSGWKEGQGEEPEEPTPGCVLGCWPEPRAGSEQISAGPGSFAHSGFRCEHPLTIRDWKSGPIFSSWVRWVSSHGTSLSEELRANSS